MNEVSVREEIEDAMKVMKESAPGENDVRRGYNLFYYKVSTRRGEKQSDLNGAEDA